MFNYEEFKEEIRSRLLSEMGEKYEKCVIEEMTVFKMGKNKDGFGVRKMNAKANTSVMPTLYYDDLYDEYLTTNDFETILSSVASAMVRGLKDGKRIKKVARDSMNYDNVVFQLVSTDSYQSLLNEVPHREFLDLAVIYRWCMDVYSDSFASAVIDNDMAQKLGYTEEELFKHAMKNTTKIFKPIIHSLQDVAFEMFVRNGASSEEARELLKKIPDGDVFYFVSNGGNPKLGATVLLNKKTIQKIANKHNSDLYILPLSSMEIIAIPVSSSTNLDKVYDTFFRLNSLSYDDEEQISDNVYYFDNTTGEITIVDPVKVGEDIDDEEEY